MPVVPFVEAPTTAPVGTLARFDAAAALMMRVACLAVLAVLAGAAPASAASFDCARASHPDERAICANRSLSDLDTEMAALFKIRMEIPMLMGSRGDAGDEQLMWLAKRRSCGGDVGCLTGAYRARIDRLGNIIADAMKDYCVKLGICG